MPYMLIQKEMVLPLTGEWQYQIGTVTEAAPSTTFFQYKPSGVYNAMIAPLTFYRFFIRIVIYLFHDHLRISFIDTASFLANL